ncbi:MAG: ATP-binding protein [Promethearchaeota archaeon]
MDLETRLLTQWEEIEKVKKSKIIEREQKTLLNTAKDSKRIKVIMGPRRAGKSTFLISEIVDEDAYYVNFDDEVLSDLQPQKLSTLVSTLHKVFGDRRKIVLDEIQNIERWELFINRLQRNYNVFITGSNSKLLSSELSTHLTGRHITIELLPFSFREFLRAKGEDPKESERGIGRLQRLLSEYLEYGGFPEIVLQENKVLKERFLADMFNDILVKDVVARKTIAKPYALLDLAKIVCSAPASRLSYRKLAESLGISDKTVRDYLSYLEEAYICFGIPKFSYKMREVARSVKKWFVYDLGYYRINKKKGAAEEWRRLENAVALKLKRKNQTIYYYLAERRYEVDLVSDLIYQICYDVEGIPQREKRTLEKAKAELKKEGVIISLLGKEKSIPLYRFLRED